MKKYEVLELCYNNYQYLVLSTSYETPLTQIDDINIELSQKYHLKQFKVVFDLLLNMGNNSERFLEAIYDEKERKVVSFNFIEPDKNSILRKTTSEYFKSNVNILENSVLNSQQKKLIGMGIPI